MRGPLDLRRPSQIARQAAREKPRENGREEDINTDHGLLTEVLLGHCGQGPNPRSSGRNTAWETPVGQQAMQLGSNWG